MARGYGLSKPQRAGINPLNSLRSAWWWLRVAWVIRAQAQRAMAIDLPRMLGIGWVESSRGWWVSAQYPPSGCKSVSP